MALPTNFCEHRYLGVTAHASVRCVVYQNSRFLPVLPTGFHPHLSVSHRLEDGAMYQTLSIWNVRFVRLAVSCPHTNLLGLHGNAKQGDNLSVEPSLEHY